MFRAVATSNPSDVELPTKIAIMDSKIAKGGFDLATDIPIDMLDSEKIA